MAIAKAFNEARALIQEWSSSRPCILHTFDTYQAKLAAWLDANPAADAETEQMFAYLHAAGIIESSCTFAHPETEDHLVWYDLDAVDEMAISVDEEADYLDTRRLLWHHPENPRWVCILDEDEPLPPAAEQAAA